MKPYKTTVHIHSLDGKMDELTVLEDLENNDYILSPFLPWQKKRGDRMCMFNRMCVFMCMCMCMCMFRFYFVARLYYFVTRLY